MTATAKVKPCVVAVEALLGHDRDLFKQLLKESLQEALEAEMTEVLGVASGERSELRSGYRAAYYSRGLITRIGKLELRVPRDREGRFSTELFERYQRSEKAPVSALAEMYVQGVSTRKVKAVTEELCGPAFSASTIRQINKGLDAALARFANRPLEEASPYLILDARYEKVRIDGAIRSQAVLIAIGINWEGATPGVGGGAGSPRERLGLEGLRAPTQGAWSHGGGVRRQRQPRRAQEGHLGAATAGRLAALLRALPAQRLGYLPRASCASSPTRLRAWVWCERCALR